MEVVLNALKDTFSIMQEFAAKLIPYANNLTQLSVFVNLAILDIRLVLMVVVWPII
jgi:hypothetical protein